ncbi:MAG TPA: hypothetical protein VD997_18075 [Phycisphaerales bacterium]|nr:hypothetical protein [Phycisphaerales bacterium]
MSTTNTNTTAAERNQRRTTNALLAAIACILGYNALNQAGVSTVSTAYAQQGGDEGMVSAAEQRKVMISELRNLSSRMERLESTLARGVNVKVTDMPPVRMADPSQMQPKESPRKASK